MNTQTKKLIERIKVIGEKNLGEKRSQLLEIANRMNKIEKELSECEKVAVALSENQIFLDTEDLPCRYTVSKLIPKSVEKYKVEYNIEEHEIIVTSDIDGGFVFTIRTQDGDTIHTIYSSGVWTTLYKRRIENLSAFEISCIEPCIPIIEKASFMFADFPRQYMALVEKKIDYLEKNEK